MKIDKRNPTHLFALALQAILVIVTLIIRPFFPRAKKPVVILYGHQFSGNLKALYMEWLTGDRHVFDFYFLTMDMDLYYLLKSQGINVLACFHPYSAIVLARSEVVITDHGLHAMSILPLVTDIKFIDVWHGIPFKGFVPDDFRLQHRYDQVWVSSPLLKSLYIDKFGFNEKQVYSLGYARTDRLFLSGSPSGSESLILDKLPSGKKVLYAPTWRQDDSGRELFPFGETAQSFIRAVADVCRIHNATLLVRSHLNAEIPELEVDNVIYCPQRDFPDTEELLLASDILICDWSSIAFDFLPLNRPTLFLDVKPPFKHGFSLGQEYRFGMVIENTESLVSTLGKTLDNQEDYWALCREKHCRILDAVYEEGQRGSAAKSQLEQLEALLTD